MAGDGVDLIARIRSQVRNMPPILALTAAVAESELADLYDAGADDVMFKPLRIAVFAARVQRWRGVSIRQELQTDVLKVGAYVIDVAARRLHLNAQPVKLSSREFDLALYLFRNVGRLVSRSTLEKAIWGRSWASIPRQWTRTSTACGSSSDCNRKTACNWPACMRRVFA